MTLDEYISNFLRDAQYRIAQLSVKMDELQDDGSYQYKKLFQQRLELIVFMAILYEGKWYIEGGYNHIQYEDTEETWNSNDIIAEIEHLRYYTNMNEVPYITFTAHYPQIASYLGIVGQVGSGGTQFPSGQPGNIIVYNNNSEPYADDVDPWGGQLINESITDFFEDRL